MLVHGRILVSSETHFSGVVSRKRKGVYTVKNPLQQHPHETPVQVRAESRSPYLLWLIWVLWLPLMIPSLITFFQAHPTLPRLLSMLVGICLFFSLYLWSAWLRVQHLIGVVAVTRHTTMWMWATIACLGVLSLVLTLIGGPAWLLLFFYTSGFIGGSLTVRQSLVTAFCFTLGVAALGWLIGLSWLAILQDIVFIPAIVFIMRSIIWSITTSWELRAAREEIARLAVVNERLRIARDLHDLLGHSLSLITLKSELAGRLVSVAPERAVNEIHDIENVARTTLQEVREAVTSYRQPTLASELHAAQELLSAAGIAYRNESDEQTLADLSPGIEAVLSWTIREGVTNVIKHSRAQQCWVKIWRDAQQVHGEIKDNGHSIVADSPAIQAGNGLRGLRERVAALGGQIETSSSPEKGFSLHVSIPLVQKRSLVSPLQPEGQREQRSVFNQEHMPAHEERRMQP